MTTRSSARSINPLALLAGLFASAVPRLERAGIAEALHDIGNKIAESSVSPTFSARMSLVERLNDYALLLGREALLRGYVTDAQVKPSKNGIQAEIDLAGDDEEQLLALLSKQVHLVGDAVALSTSGSDTGVTRASLAQYLRDLATDGREQDVPMGVLVESANPVFDRAIEADFITEGEIQGATVLFSADREGGFKYLAYITDRIQSDAFAEAAVA